MVLGRLVAIQSRDDDNGKKSINLLAKVFRVNLCPAAREELNATKRSVLIREALITKLSDVHFRYCLKTLGNKKAKMEQEPSMSGLVCSKS